MELTFPRGTLTPEFRADVDAFYGPIFGWRAVDTPVMGQSCHLLMVDDHVGQFLLLAESDAPMSSPGYDHLGLLQDTRAEVDSILEQCLAFQAHDERVKVKQYKDDPTATMTIHAFYVKYLLPIWFDVQSMERHDGSPNPGWTYQPISSAKVAAP
ncbi:MAG: hypothetical protein JWM34_2449 [Ilumatobacteraceae bacterium]|nr:hypothetical protein [Ilumatobacteraceae bacterium]